MGNPTMGKNTARNEDNALLFYIECKYKGNSTLYGVTYNSTTRIAITWSTPFTNINLKDAWQNLFGGIHGIPMYRVCMSLGYTHVTCV